MILSNSCNDLKVSPLLPIKSPASSPWMSIIAGSFSSTPVDLILARAITSNDLRRCDTIDNASPAIPFESIRRTRTLAGSEPIPKIPDRP